MIYNAEYRPDPVSLALSFDSSLADAPENGRNQRHIRQLNRFGLINTLRTLNINPDRYLVEEFPEMDGNVKSKLLIDDNNHKISDAFAGRIEKFIRNGGVFLASRDTDRKNNWRFFERFGIRFDGKTFTGCPVAEGLFPVAEKAVGKGKIVILGKSWPFTGFDEGDESPEYRAFMQKQLLRIGGFRPLVRSDVTAVCALPYRDADGSLLLYAVNLRCTPAKVTLGLNADALPQAAAVTDFRAGTVERPVKSKDGYWEQTLEIPPLSASLLRFN
jgi:hypothetical protein